MRIFLAAFVFALALTPGFSTADATPLASSNMFAGSLTKAIPVAHHCGKGSRWVPAGYAKHGKYRAGHCAPA